MKKLLKALLIISVITGTYQAQASTNCVTECCDERCCDDEYSCEGFMLTRSFGSNTARRIVGSHLFTNRFDCENFNQVLSFTVGGARTFDNEKIGRYFAPICGTNCFSIGKDGEADVRAEDFGLSCTANVCLCPKSSSFILDVQYFLGLDPICEGLFFEAFLPVVHTRREINCCVDTSETCSGAFEPCLMSLVPANNETATTDVSQALNGAVLWGDVTNEMCFGSLCCSEQKTGVADLQFALGYRFMAGTNYNLGLKIIAKAPTGTKSTATMLFEPTIGNGAHFELGGGIAGFCRFWEKDVDHSLMLNFEMDVTHLFTSRTQTRLFDLNNRGCYSRYLLLKQFDESLTGTDSFTVSGLERGPNVFAQNIKVSIPYQVDASILLSFQRGCWLADIGYNFWARGEEREQEFCPSLPGNTYGIKGTTPMCTLGTDAPDNQTANLSTISESKGFNGATDGTNPTFINCADINICSALAPSARSHSVIGNITYLWNDVCHTPWIGVGTQVEFSGNGNAVLTQWQLWAKAGITF